MWAHENLEFKNFKLSEIDLEFRGYGQFQKILHQMSGPKKKIIESQGWLRSNIEAKFHIYFYQVVKKWFADEPI